VALGTHRMLRARWTTTLIYSLRIEAEARHCDALLAAVKRPMPLRSTRPSEFSAADGEHIA